MTKTTAAVLVACVLLSGCAKKSANIEPAAISTSKYSTWSCTQLKREKSFTDTALIRKSSAQDKAAQNDAVMVFLIGVPTSGGGIPGEVARLKGEQEAIRKAMIMKRC
ncbi:MAG: hypothetical protein ABJF50_24025 [Paracoccaceae bacterium]